VSHFASGPTHEMTYETHFLDVFKCAFLFSLPTLYKFTLLTKL